MKYMYKSLTGWREADEKHKETHVLLTDEEYKKLCEERDQAIRERDTAEISAKDTVNEERWKAKKQIEEMVTRLKAETKEKEYQMSLNKNLLRIVKERSNVERNLKPKKSHTGYVVLSSCEKEIKYKMEKTIETAKVWETIIQSPYTVDFTEEQARKMIYEELVTMEGGFLIGKIGITMRWFDSFDKIVKIEDYKDDNIVFEGNLRESYRSGYWEYIVKHTKPLATVPDSMRVRQK